MSSRPQVAPAIDYVPSMFETDSSIISKSNVAIAVSCPNVLLVGRNGSWGTLVLRSLEKFGANCPSPRRKPSRRNT